MTEAPIESPAAIDAIERIALDATRLSIGDDDATMGGRVLVVPWGNVRSESGDFVVDAAGIASVLEAFASHGTDLPVDYEHQTLGGPYASPTGRAPAAGWITALHAVAPEIHSDMSPGLWADVAWTDDAKHQLAARHYRYLSPVALVRKSDRRLIGLHSVALTNKPAIVGMTPVINRQSPAATDTIDITPLRAALQLGESTTATDIITAAVTRLTELDRRECERLATERVDAAYRAGKLSPPQREWAIALAARDPAEFDRFVASAPAVVPLGRISASTVNSVDAAVRAVETAARVEWRAHRAFLEKLCTEDAYAAAARRDLN